MFMVKLSSVSDFFYLWREIHEGGGFLASALRLLKTSRSCTPGHARVGRIGSLETRPVYPLKRTFDRMVRMDQDPHVSDNAWEQSIPPRGGDQSTIWSWLPRRVQQYRRKLRPRRRASSQGLSALCHGIRMGTRKTPRLHSRTKKPRIGYKGTNISARSFRFLSGTKIWIYFDGFSTPSIFKLLSLLIF
jgi:hypothetical protein